MSKKEVLERLGKPDIIEINHSKAFDFYFKEAEYTNEIESTKGYEWGGSIDNYFDNFYEKSKYKNDIDDIIKSSKNTLICYRYDYEETSIEEFGIGYQNVYFIDDEVIALT